MKRRAPERTLCAVGVLLIILISYGSVFALDPSLDVRQYAHTAWKSREGFAKGIITAIAHFTLPIQVAESSPLGCLRHLFVLRYSNLKSGEIRNIGRWVVQLAFGRRLVEHFG